MGFFRNLFENIWVWLGGEITAPDFADSSSRSAPISTPVELYPSAAPQGVATTPTSKEGPAPPPITVTVQPGDTLFSIADQYNVSVQAIIQINRLSSSKIYIDQRLILPPTASPPPPSPDKPKPPAGLQLKKKPTPRPVRRVSPDPAPREQGALDLAVEPKPPPAPKAPPKTTPPPTKPPPEPELPPPYPPEDSLKPKPVPKRSEAKPPAQKPVQKPRLTRPPSAQPLPEPRPIPRTRPTASPQKPVAPPEPPPPPPQEAVPVSKSTPASESPPKPKSPATSPPPLDQLEESRAETSEIVRPRPAKTSEVYPPARTDLPEKPLSKPAAKASPKPRLRHFPPPAIQGIYMAYHTLGSRKERVQIMDFIKTSRLNAVVLEIKNDRGYLSYRSQVPLAADLAANRPLVEDMGQVLTRFKSNGIYTIARIVSYKDNLLARAYPDLAAKHPGTGEIWHSHHHAAWVDPFRAEVWDYNLQLAAEAAQLGFDEIQFDALRFPTPGPAGPPQFSQELTAESRLNAIAGFLSAARGRLSPLQVKIGANILGYACWREDDALVGHNIDRLAPYLDVLSPLLYPSTFVSGIPGYANPTGHPAEVVAQGTRRAVERVKNRAPSCQIRPWIQDFQADLFAERPFGLMEIQSQITGAVEGGAAGFMAWNPQTVYTQGAYGDRHI